MRNEVKIKLSALWMLMVVGLLVHGQLHFFEAGGVPKQGTGMLMFNRWLNVIAGGLFLLMNLYHLWGHRGEPHQVLIIGATVVMAALILRYSWRDLRESIAESA
jgi:uncharacterized membrane protein (DUF2068 family)